MADLRPWARPNPLGRTPPGTAARAILARMMEVYADRFRDPDGRIRASFDIICCCRLDAPHESQQQPLQPGSAKARLADALGNPGDQRGEKPGRG